MPTHPSIFGMMLTSLPAYGRPRRASWIPERYYEDETTAEMEARMAGERAREATERRNDEAAAPLGSFAPLTHKT